MRDPADHPQLTGAALVRGYRAARYLTPPAKETSTMTEPVDDLSNLHIRIDQNMTNQAPIGSHVVAAFEALRVPFRQAAHTAVDLCPDSPELRRSLDLLEHALMDAVAAIARNQDRVPEHFTGDGGGEAPDAYVPVGGTGEDVTAAVPGGGGALGDWTVSFGEPLRIGDGWGAPDPVRLAALSHACKLHDRLDPAEIITAAAAQFETFLRATPLPEIDGLRGAEWQHEVDGLLTRLRAAWGQGLHETDIFLRALRVCAPPATEGDEAGATPA